MKIKLTELGLSCEKKKLRKIIDIQFFPINGEDWYIKNRNKIINKIHSENAKSVLVIESQNLENLIRKFADKLWENKHRNIHEIDHAHLAEFLSQNAKSFMRIEKE